MKLTLFPPSLIFYTDALPDGVGGCANGPVARIRPKYRDDVGLYKHEELHVWQWWLTAGLHSLLYYFVRRYRLWAEVQAYHRQMKFPRADGSYMTIEEAAQHLTAERYRVDLTPGQALAIMRRTQ